MMFSTETVEFGSLVNSLQQEIIQYSSTNRDAVLVLLSEILTTFEIQQGSDAIAKTRKLCEETHLLGMMETLLKLNDRFICHLSDKVLCWIFGSLPSLFLQSQLLEKSLSSLGDKSTRELVASFLRTIDGKLKRGEGLHDIHHAVVEKCLHFVIPYFKNILNTTNDACTMKETDYTDVNKNDKYRVNVEELVDFINITHTIVKIIKHQHHRINFSNKCQNVTTSTFTTTRQNNPLDPKFTISNPPDPTVSTDLTDPTDLRTNSLLLPSFTQLSHCVCDILKNICSGHLTSSHLVWRGAIKVLERLQKISLIDPNFPCTTQDVCVELSNILGRDSVQRRMVFVESAFHGVKEESFRHDPCEIDIVLDDVCGRRLVLFLLRVLKQREVKEETRGVYVNEKVSSILSW